jgi:hypothetical protein
MAAWLNLTRRPHFTQEVRVRLERLGNLKKKSREFIGNGTRDLPVCSIVPLNGLGWSTSNTTGSHYVLCSPSMCPTSNHHPRIRGRTFTNWDLPAVSKVQQGSSVSKVQQGSSVSKIQQGSSVSKVPQGSCITSQLVLGCFATISTPAVEWLEFRWW